MKLSGIYKIQSKKKPERIYIGSSVDIHSRWSYHRRGLIRGDHANSRPQNHFNKYGLNDLEFSVIVGGDKNMIIALEQFYIDALNPWFNICPTAGTPVGISHEKRRGKPTWNKGKKLSEEHKKRIAESMAGEKNPMYGKPSPKKGQKSTYVTPWKGKTGRYSEATLEKMRKSNQLAADRRRQRKEESCPA